MKNLSLRQLRYFEALARHRHFGRAAADVSISQPALSMQIRELEDSLGAPLVEKGPRQVMLTAFGQSMLPRIREILQSVDALGDAARAAGEGMAGPLRLGMIPTVAPYLLPPLLRAVGKAFPALDIHVRETITPRLMTELSDGKLDAVIVALPVADPALTFVKLFSEPFLLARPKSEARKPVPSRADLADMRLLLLEEGHCFRDQALSFCRPRGHTMREGLDATTLSTLMQMVAAGQGVTLIPAMAAAVEARGLPVTLTPLDDPQPARTLGLVWRKSSGMANKLREITAIAQRLG